MPSAEALILRTVDFSESSRIVTFYTRTFGKIEALAKGGRRLKSPFESSLDILALDSVAFIQKRGDVLDILTESKLIRRFRVHSANLAGTLGGYYVAELVNSFTAVGDPMPGLYDLAVKVLTPLEEGKQVMRTLIRFEGRFLHIIGHLPSIRHCAACGTEVPKNPPGKIIFAIEDGGILCTDCQPVHRQNTWIHHETLEMWNALISPKDKSEQWKSLPINQQMMGEIRRISNLYICSLLGWKPRLHDWWNVIAKHDRDDFP